MKRVLQVLLFAAACGAFAATAAEEPHQTGTSSLGASAQALIAFNFPKITYGRGVNAARADQGSVEVAA